MSVRDAKEQISSREFTQWVAKERIDPGNPLRDDIRTALICWTIHSTVRGALGGKGKAPQISDFLLKFEEKNKRFQDPEVLKAKMMTWAAQYRAHQKKEEKKDAGRKHIDSGHSGPEGLQHRRRRSPATS